MRVVYEDGHLMEDRFADDRFADVHRDDRVPGDEEEGRLPGLPYPHREHHLHRG